MGKDRTLGWVFAVITIMAALIFTLVAASFKTESILLDNEQLSELSAGLCAKTENGETKETSLPSEFIGNTVSLIITLPMLTDRDVLQTEITGQKIRVYVEGIEEPIYTHGYSDEKVPFGKGYGKIYNIIELSSEYSGKEMRIEYSSDYNSGKISVQKIEYGSKSAAIFSMIKKNIPVVIFSAVMIFMGVIFIIISIVIKLRKVSLGIKDFLYLGLFIILSVLWVITNSSFLQLFIGNKPLLYYTSYLSFMMMPLPLIYFIRNVFSHGKRLMNTLLYLFALNFVISWGLHIFNIADIHNTIIVTQGLIILTIIFILITAAVEIIKYKTNGAKIIVVAVVFLAIATGIDLVIYFINPGHDTSMLFRIGLSVFVVLLSYFILKQASAFLGIHIQSQFLQKMAFNDIMTGMPNRLAYENMFDEMKRTVDTYSSVCVVVFDLNHLKCTNDRYGHAAGDELLKSAAHCIKSAFYGVGTSFRIGGDEFVVLAKNIKPGAVTKALGLLDLEIDDHNTGNLPYELSLARGYCYAKVENGALPNLDCMFTKADEKMYANKVAMKANRKI